MRNPFQYPGLRILTFFFNEPYRDFYLREIAEQVNVSPSTAKAFLDYYKTARLLLKTKRANLVLFKANTENPSFRMMKLGVFLLKAAPLTDFLAEKYPDSSVVLYGSCARGEDDSESDLDLLIVGKKIRHVDMSAYEKQLSRRIALLVYSKSEWEDKAKMDKAFYERILVDGVAIHGTLPVVKQRS